MDRRSFVTSVLMSVGIFAAAVGAANALPAVAPRDHLVSASKTFGGGAGIGGAGIGAAAIGGVGDEDGFRAAHH